MDAKKRFLMRLLQQIPIIRIKQTLTTRQLLYDTEVESLKTAYSTTLFNVANNLFDNLDSLKSLEKTLPKILLLLKRQIMGRYQCVLNRTRQCARELLSADSIKSDAFISLPKHMRNRCEKYSEFNRAGIYPDSHAEPG